MNASCGISTFPNWRMRFLPAFCLSSSLRLRLAVAFLRGELQPLETALALSSLEDEAPEELRDALISMVAVSSETDDIPLGERRALWHPDVRPSEDRKHDAAQAWAAPIVREACERLASAL